VMGLVVMVCVSISYGYVMSLQGSNSLVVGVDDSPVLVELYYESLCPGCRAFLTTSLYPTFLKLQNTGLLKVNLYPYGNGHQKQKADGSWEFTCQHGVPECLGNLLEVCILSHLGWDQNLFLPVISCMEGADDPITSARGCVRDLAPSISFRDIKKCSNGLEGNKLMHEMGLATEKLEPSHKYVPWVVVDKKHNETIQQEAMENLLGLVCRIFKGEKPAVCQEKQVNNLVHIAKEYA